MADIHPTAIVDPRASLAPGVVIGPYCVVGPECQLDDGVRLHAHAIVDGRTAIGPGTEIYPFAAVGLPPQDLKYRGEASRLEIGARNRIREYVTVNPGTEGGGMVTRIGDDNLFMVGSHIAHDCIVGNHVIVANNVALAGHVTIGDYAVIGGLSGVHQFVRVGAHAMIGGMSAVDADIIPYGAAMGNRAHLAGLNVIGLKRRGFPKQEITALREAYALLFEDTDTDTLNIRLEQVAMRFAGNPTVMEIVVFLRNRGSRALTQPAQG